MNEIGHFDKEAFQSVFKHDKRGQEFLDKLFSRNLQEGQTVDNWELKTLNGVHTIFPVVNELITWLTAMTPRKADGSLQVKVAEEVLQSLFQENAITYFKSLYTEIKSVLEVIRKYKDITGKAQPSFSQALRERNLDCDNTFGSNRFQMQLIASIIEILKRPQDSNSMTLSEISRRLSRLIHSQAKLSSEEISFFETIYTRFNSKFTYPDKKEIYDLPRTVAEAVKRDFDPIFDPHYNPNREEFMDPFIIQHYDALGGQYPYPISVLQEHARHLRISSTAGFTYMTQGTETHCIVCGNRLEQRFCPKCGHDNGILASYIGTPRHCRARNCDAPLITGICPCCGVDNRLAPAYHPQLVAWLETFYADSYEALFDLVRAGESLAEPLLSRFIHETTRHHYQLLFNTASGRLDPLISDALTEKFSITWTDSTKIIL